MFSFFETVYRPRRLAQASRCTIEHYRCLLRALARHLGRPPILDDLRDETIVGFLAAYASTHAPASVLAARHQLLALWRFAARRRPDLEEPDLGPMRVPQVNPTAWTPQEIAQLFHAARRFRPRELGWRTYCGVIPSFWWSGFLAVQYDTGFRKSATLHLSWADMDLTEGWAIARAAYQKTDRDEVRTLSPETTAALSAMRQPQRERVFPFHGSDITYYHHFRTILHAAGLSTTYRDLTQRLRRTHATWLAVAAGKAAAQESLGHSSMRLTERAYLDARFVRPINGAALLPRPKL